MSFNTKVSFSHVSYIPSLPSSGDCPTLYVEADFSMDGSDLLTSQLTSESCPWDLKGFYLFYSHVYFFNSLSDFTYVYVWNKWRKGQILLSLLESMLCTDKT